MMKKLAIVIYFLMVLSSISCDNNRVFEDEQSIPDYVWKDDFTPSFNVEVTDTTYLYNIYITVRHTFYYGYRNLWVNIYTQFPNGEKLKKRIELPLADNEGKWYGECLGDICDTQIPIQRNAFFEKPGSYTFEIQPNMRENPLPMVMSIGLRLEKAGKRKDI